MSKKNKIKELEKRIERLEQLYFDTSYTNEERVLRDIREGKGLKPIRGNRLVKYSDDAPKNCLATILGKK